MLTNCRKKQKIPQKLPKLPKDCCISPKMKVRLDALETNGRLIWNLSERQANYISENYHYTVTPHIYEIKTACFIKRKEQPAIIKQLTKGAYEGRKHINRALKKQDKDLLDSLNIDYKPVKYIIQV